MSSHTWLLFVGTVLLLSGTPGTNMLHIVTRSISVGPRRVVASMAGCLTALILILTASALGMGAVLATVPILFMALRYAGAAYLFYLGIKAWRSSVDNPRIEEQASAGGSASRLFRSGLGVGLSNPKLLLFAAALLPQFVDQRAPVVVQFAILIATFAVIETGWMACYALAGRSLMRFLDKPARRTLFNRVTGGIFAGFAVFLIADRA